MDFIKNFINVLSVASISFILLSAVFGMLIYVNLLDGRVKEKGGMAFVIFGAICAVAGLFVDESFQRLERFKNLVPDEADSSERPRFGE